MEEKVKSILEDLKSKFEINREKYHKSSEESEKLLEMIEKLNTEIGELKEKQEILRNPKAYKRKINKNINTMSVVCDNITTIFSLLFGACGGYILFTNNIFSPIIKYIVICILGVTMLSLVKITEVELINVFKIKRKNKLRIEDVLNNYSLEEIEQLLFSKEKQLEEANDKERQLSIDIEKYGKTANDLATSHNMLLENYEILSSPKEEVTKLEQITRKRDF